VLANKFDLIWFDLRLRNSASATKTAGYGAGWLDVELQRGVCGIIQRRRPSTSVLSGCAVALIDSHKDRSCVSGRVRLVSSTDWRGASTSRSGSEHPHPSGLPSTLTLTNLLTILTVKINQPQYLLEIFGDRILWVNIAVVLGLGLIFAVCASFQLTSLFKNIANQVNLALGLGLCQGSG